jgi:hypothetical protein
MLIAREGIARTFKKIPVPQERGRLSQRRCSQAGHATLDLAGLRRGLARTVRENGLGSLDAGRYQGVTRALTGLELIKTTTPMSWDGPAPSSFF